MVVPGGKAKFEEARIDVLAIHTSVRLRLTLLLHYAVGMNEPRTTS